MKSQVTWISHRGVTEHCVENTQEAFDAAVACGFPALETDLRCCRSGEIVLAHDPTLQRLTGKANAIADLTREELEALTLEGGAKLLFWDAFAIRFAKLQWVLDIKPEGAVQTLHALAAWAKANNQEKALVAKSRFLTWHKAHELLVQQLFPGAVFYARSQECWRAGLCTLCKAPWLGGIQAGKIYSLTPTVRGIPLYRRHIIEAYHRRGAKVLAFLPETPQEAQAAIQAGCDQILTNYTIL